MTKKDVIRKMEELIIESADEEVYNASQDDLLKAIAIGIKYLVKHSK